MPEKNCAHFWFPPVLISPVMLASMFRASALRAAALPAASVKPTWLKYASFQPRVRATFSA